MVSPVGAAVGVLAGGAVGGLGVGAEGAVVEGGGWGGRRVGHVEGGGRLRAACCGESVGGVWGVGRLLRAGWVGRAAGGGDLHVPD